MEKQFEKLMEIRNQKGEVLWSVWCNSNQAKAIKERIGEQGNSESKTEEGKETGQNPETNEDLMTDAQKRYLFRLLAKRGIEGDAAHRHLKEAFHVDALKKITKLDASQAIDRMLNS